MARAKKKKGLYKSSFYHISVPILSSPVWTILYFFSRRVSRVERKCFPTFPLAGSCEKEK